MIGVTVSPFSGRSSIVGRLGFVDHHVTRSDGLEDA